MKARRLSVLAGILLCISGARVMAGGSGLNVAVVINQASADSLALGNYFCERRQVPPQNVLFINWTNGNLVWDLPSFTSTLYNPLLAMLASRQLTNQIDYVVLSMDIPYSVSTPGDGYDSTTSSLFYGFKPDPNPQCSMAPGSTNLYAGSESIFRLTPPISAASNSFLVTMITSSNLALAKQIVDSGVSSDFTFPTQTVLLIKGMDVDRNVRFATFDNAIFDTRLRGNYSMRRTNYSGFPPGIFFGGQTGEYSYNVPPALFVPGSMADNLTSYGGLILADNSGQLSMLSLLAAGAAGSYGTVSEPCNYLEKFPSPLNYFYQARGFSLAECYYQSITNPYQGLIIGEPLAAPFAQPAAGASWINPSTNAPLSGTTNLSCRFAASDAKHPLQQVDLFVDGLWFETLTNIAPARSNLIAATLNGQTVSYSVPPGASIQSVADGFSDALNSASNLTHIAAFPVGDRIELHSMDRARPGAQVSLSVSNAPGTGPADTTFIAASRPSFLDTIAQGIQGFQILGNPAAGSYLQMAVVKTNGTPFLIGVTNTSGSLDLVHMTQAILDGVNTNAALALPDGLGAQDFISAMISTQQFAQFNLQANSAGWNAAEIQTTLIASPDLATSPSGAVYLDQNLPDLQPRDHLYITAGVTNLSLTFPLNTASLADGFHQLTAVAYEGSHVRTQTSASWGVQIRNTGLSALLMLLDGGTNYAVEGTLRLTVAANTNNISSIQLFGTGGILGSISNQASATFSIAGTSLGVGLHPFYALVTAANGNTYRTQTLWVRLVGGESPFPVSISAPPPTLTWPAVPGRAYSILSATNLAAPFQVTATVTASNSAVQWTDGAPAYGQRFYRVESANQVY